AIIAILSKTRPIARLFWIWSAGADGCGRRRLWSGGLRASGGCLIGEGAGLHQHASQRMPVAVASLCERVDALFAGERALRTAGACAWCTKCGVRSRNLWNGRWWIRAMPTPNIAGTHLALAVVSRAE